MNTTLESLTAHDTGVNVAEIENIWETSRTYQPFDWLPFDEFSLLNRTQRPLSAAWISLITTSGTHFSAQVSFDTRPKSGDPKFRQFPSTALLDELTLRHIGSDTRRATADKNVVLPFDRLRELIDDGLFTAHAPTVFSTMGFVAEPADFFRESCRDVARLGAAEESDPGLLVPC